jgi:hypothetical protein
VTAGEVLPDVAVCRELASVLRAGDDAAATGLAVRAGIPSWLLAHPELGPRGRLDTGDVGEVLGCISVLAAGHGVSLALGLAKPAVIDLVAEAVETAAAQGATARHPWARGIEAVEECGRPAIAMLLRARVEEGSGRSDEARQLTGSCLRLEEDLLPAIRDAMEYELCAGNWARAWELAAPPRGGRGQGHQHAAGSGRAPAAPRDTSEDGMTNPRSVAGIFLGYVDQGG